MRILFLVHRVPFPPNRGDRIRSHRVLELLASRGEVHLGCLADEPVPAETTAYLARICAQHAVFPVGGARRWLRAGLSAARGKTATEGLFWSPTLADTIRRWAADTPFDLVVGFCSSMAPYLDLPGLRGRPAIVDLVDVDSQKWFDYADKTRGPKRALFQLEGKRLRRLECSLAQRCEALVVVTDAEAKILRSFCPDAPVHAIGNGVDLEYFTPPVNAPVECDVTFVGALDYRANVDGIVWFCDQVWPTVKKQVPQAMLTLVGRQPVPAVQALAALPGVRIAADVPDVRPYLSRAAVVIAPLRIARGIQNKVLEAAAMAKAIVASPAAAEGLTLVPGVHLLAAAEPAEWSAALVELLSDQDRRHQLGTAARVLVEQEYSWEQRLAPLARLLDSCVDRPQVVAAPPARRPVAAAL